MTARRGPRNTPLARPAILRRPEGDALPLVPTESGLRITELPSPNQDERPPGVPVDTLVLHYTDMESGEAAIARLRDPEARVSSHYVVEEDGQVFRLVPEERRAFHAGLSHWRGNELLNGRSIGIEVVNPGHSLGYRPFPALQMAALADLILGILERHPIPARNVVGHSDVSPDRKRDPGELFDWRGLASLGIGLWPEALPGGTGPGDLSPVPGGMERAAELMRRIGYKVDPARPEVALIAFQRHWRQEEWGGRADAGTLARLEAVAALAEAG
ncbi:N-acetylmuramoyl-L-alanine amidase [Roseomonas pecuniae]|uniref:N-acetylmuramoyl-L-alanine amidase n=1 Tax=Muricoccus pecuniae TaxID=693023 RepID=A0A840XY66_9PROT|nr:N-acetylmuramoyl-L-alanine amidase [Roseomonas pecuniae]